MCPDLHTLSAYLDGEVAVRWAKEIEKHLTECTSCRENLKRIEAVNAHLGDVKIPDFRVAQDRVWTRLQLHHEGALYHRVPLMKRRIAVPLSLAATVACLVILMGFALVFLSARAGIGTMKITTKESGFTELLIQASMKELQEFLGSLERQNAMGGVVIPLPENTSFKMIGEPVFKRDMDFSGGR